MDHNLSQARQRAVIAIASQKQQIVNEANRAIAELDESLADLAATYAWRSGAHASWALVKGKQSASWRARGVVGHGC